MTVYLVTGKLAYRLHKHGETFEADLTPDEERRAVERGAIAVIERRPTELQEGSFRPPDDWQPPEPTGPSPGHTAPEAGTQSFDEPPAGGSLVEGSTS